MRKRILELLRNSKGTPVSGEEISKELEVSRTAIWKHIQALKNEGYEIESVPKRGYLLRFFAVQGFYGNFKFFSVRHRLSLFLLN